jgi:hypothetical protein
MSPPPKISRRALTLGGIAAAGAAAVAGAVYEVPRYFKRRARGHYADLVNRLDDPEQAAILGKAVDRAPGDAGQSFVEEAASDLKKRLSNENLSRLMLDDATDIRRMVEADGWVIPLALAELCVLAAQSV